MAQIGVLCAQAFQQPCSVAVALLRIVQGSLQAS